MDCRRTLGQIVLPIFYDVDPWDVRKPTDTDHKVARWRAALTEASNLSGWDLRNALDRHEAKLIRKIIKDITMLLNTS
ncbi:unnamed protein product [Prunus armeniaca]